MLCPVSRLDGGATYARDSFAVTLTDGTRCFEVFAVGPPVFDRLINAPLALRSKPVAGGIDGVEKQRQWLRFFASSAQHVVRIDKSTVCAVKSRLIAHAG